MKAKYVGVILALVAVISIVAVSAYSMKSIKVAPPFTCPAQTGSCTVGKCVEDLGTPPINACEYDCVGGSYTAGTECGTNMCSGADCNQGK